MNVLASFFFESNKKAELGSEDYQKTTEAVFRNVKGSFNRYEGK